MKEGIFINVACKISILLKASFSEGWKGGSFTSCSSVSIVNFEQVNAG